MSDSEVMAIRHCGCRRVAMLGVLRLGRGPRGKRDREGLEAPTRASAEAARPILPSAAPPLSLTYSHIAFVLSANANPDALPLLLLPPSSSFTMRVCSASAARFITLISFALLSSHSFVLANAQSTTDLGTVTDNLGSGSLLRASGRALRGQRTDGAEQGR